MNEPARKVLEGRVLGTPDREKYPISVRFSRTDGTVTVTCEACRDTFPVTSFADVDRAMTDHVQGAHTG